MDPELLSLVALGLKQLANFMVPFNNMVPGGPKPRIPSLIRKKVGTRSYAMIMANFINPHDK